MSKGATLELDLFMNPAKRQGQREKDHKCEIKSQREREREKIEKGRNI